MARNDTSIAFYNYPVATTTATTETVLLAPTATGIYAGLPSPVFPASTTANPCGLNLTVPPDVALGEFDGHAFEVLIAYKLTTTATTSFTINLYNYTAAVLAGGPSATGYLGAAITGTGVTKLITGTATAVGTGGASVNGVFRAQFIWDSASKVLAASNTPVQFQKGATVTLTATNATVTGLGQTDLNFAPSFTYSVTNSPTLVITEFVINRI